MNCKGVDLTQNNLFSKLPTSSPHDSRNSKKIPLVFPTYKLIQNRRGRNGDLTLLGQLFLIFQFQSDT